VFAFADPEIIHLAKTAFVPACADDWYQRRRSDAEGRFWKRITSQGPRDADAPTHQGIYVLTADGELLAFKNAGQDAMSTRDQLTQGLRKWHALPDARRRPNSVSIPDRGPLDPNYSRTPPEGGLIVRVHARILDSDGENYRKGVCVVAGGDRAARDFLWLTAAEVKSLAAIPPTEGRESILPETLFHRILRYHLVDNTRGEPDFWSKADIRTASLRLIVSDVTADGIAIQLDGDAILETGSRGYEARLFGRIRIAPDRTIERFDLVAIGEHWGSGTFTKGERPGRKLLGVTFEVADPTVPANRVTPQGARDAIAYLGH
jgi:hypothetical protein